MSVFIPGGSVGYLIMPPDLGSGFAVHRVPSYTFSFGSPTGGWVVEHPHLMDGEREAWKGLYPVNGRGAPAAQQLSLQPHHKATVSASSLPFLASVH